MTPRPEPCPDPSPKTWRLRCSPRGRCFLQGFPPSWSRRGSSRCSAGQCRQWSTSEQNEESILERSLHKTPTCHGPAASWRQRASCRCTFTSAAPKCPTYFRTTIPLGGKGNERTTPPPPSRSPSSACSFPSHRPRSPSVACADDCPTQSSGSTTRELCTEFQLRACRASSSC